MGIVEYALWFDNGSNSLADKMWPGGDHQHRFFLAMAYWQVPEKEKARRAYQQGVEWMDKNQPANEEMRRFRAEAETVLKVEKK